MSTRAVAERLRELRKAAGLTQRQVAEKIGVNRRTVYEWEDAQRLPYQALPLLAELYETTPRFLLYGIESEAVELAELRDEVADLRASLTAFAELTEKTLGEIRRLLLDGDAPAEPEVVRRPQ